MADDSCLDDLLDEALGDLDVADQQREERQKQERRAHEEAAEQLLREDGLPELGGADKELMEVMMKLMGQLAAGGGGGGGDDGRNSAGGPADADFTAIHASLEGVIAKLEGDCATAEDQQQLKQCRELLGKLSSVDHTPHEPTPEEVEQLNAAIKNVLEHGEAAAPTASASAAGAGEPPAGGASPRPAGMDAELQKMLAEMQASAAVGSDGGAGDGSSTEAPPGSDTFLKDMLHQFLDPQVIAEPFRNSFEAYPAWFDAHAGSAAPDDVARYRKQFDLMGELVRLIDSNNLQRGVSDDATPDERAALDRFTSLVTELQALGEPPAEMMAAIARRHAGGE